MFGFCSKEIDQKKQRRQEGLGKTEPEEQGVLSWFHGIQMHSVRLGNCQRRRKKKKAGQLRCDGYEACTCKLSTCFNCLGSKPF